MQLIKKIIPYTVSLGMACLLLMYTYQNVSLKELGSQMQQFKLSWIGLSVLFDLSSHLVRAYRWNLLLYPLGFRVSLLKSFMTLMIGYMGNLLIPRLGAIIHCVMLGRVTGIPIGILLGTLAVERLIDLAGFLMIILLTLLVSFPEMKSSLQHMPFPQINGWSWNWILVGSVIILGLLGIILYHAYKQSVLAKIKPFISSAKKGFYAIQLSKTKKLIGCMTLLKWGLYYVGDYIGVFASEATAQLNWKAGLAILTMSSISFAIPIQGGIGAYHMLVSGVLVAYGVSQSPALLYAIVIHATRLVTMLVVGGMGILFVNLKSRERIKKKS